MNNDTPISGNLGQPGPKLHPENGSWRPESKRVGISPLRYVWWNTTYTILEFFNRKLSQNSNRRVSWDKWPPILGLVYLVSKIRFNRSNALTDPYDYKTNDNDSPGNPQPNPASITADGKWISDDINSQMGAAMTRFGSNIAPRRVRPDVDAILPTARTVSKKLRWRKLDEDGVEVTSYAMILNVVAQAWIQFQFHGFGGNTLRDPINNDPYNVPRDPDDGWPNNQAVIDRTTDDPTRVTKDGRPTPINEKVHAWVQGQLYGNNEEELNRLRKFANGELLLDNDGYMLEDPSRLGVDLTGYSNNYSPFLSFLHWLFTKEHNAIAQYLSSFHPDMNDEQLFQLARKTNCAQIARIHTIEWTEDLLQHPTLQLGMHADWYGLFGQRLKCYLMRISARYPLIGKLLKPIQNNDIIWGMPGSAWEHHDGPFQVPKHFRLVYRLHEMVLGTNEICDPESGKLLKRIQLLDFVHENTRKYVKQYGYETLGWSFLRQSCGALQLHNFPRSFTKFPRMQDKNLIDLAELDIFREREDGTGTYNDLRRSLGEPPVTSFLELTGGDVDLAKEIELVYQGDVNKVDAGIGILAEPKPRGFALGFVQFYQFVLNAPRRVKSNRFLSEGYNYNEFQEGMNWIEHGGGFKGVIRRHLQKLEAHLEGVQRGFAPWPDAETFPERLLEETNSDISRAMWSDTRAILLGSVAGGISVHYGIFSFWPVLSVLLLFVIASVTMTIVRSVARRLMQVCEKRCNTDRRKYMFRSLYLATQSIDLAARASWFSSAIALFIAEMCAGWLWSSAKWLSLLYCLCGLSTLTTLSWSNKFIADAIVLKVALRNRMRRGESQDRSSTNIDHPSVPELNKLLRSYAPGRQYFTAYDFRRMFEIERKNGLCRNQLRNWKKLLFDHADLVVEENRKLVPAITYNVICQILNGTAEKNLSREKSVKDTIRN